MEEKIQIFIPDASYDNDKIFPSDFRQQLHDHIKSIETGGNEIKIQPLLQTNIGAGADWPALYTEIIPVATTYAPLALFFLGKKINENLDAWVLIGGKLHSLLQQTGGWLNRGAALIVSLFKIKEKLGKLYSIEIIQYESLDGRFIDDWKTVDPDKKSVISDDLADEYRGGQIHYFRIKANNTELEVIVYGDRQEIREIRGENQT